MKCATCTKWLLRRVTKYGSGEVITNWADAEGKGKCSHLGIVTAPEFGCTAYQDGGPLIEESFKEGEPWHYSVLGPCPQCKGLGAAVTDPKGCQCCGTGLVNYYDDGYIGENKTKMHPKEKACGKRPSAPTPTCFNCGRGIELNWLMCPYCATRLKEPKPDVVEGALTS